MKLRGYISLITLVTACVLFTPGYIYGENHKSKTRNDNNKKSNIRHNTNNKNDNQDQNHKGNVQNDRGKVQDNRNNVQNDRDKVLQRHVNIHDDRGRVQNNRPTVQYNRNYVHNNGIPTKYQYRGRYRNFRNFNHGNRYYYGGNYYNFDDYYRHYSHENYGFIYEGSYRRHNNFFIFTDRYGNEFDLYLKPYKRTPFWFRGSPLQLGRPYHMRMKPTRYYATPDEMRIGLNLNFGWGNVTLQNRRYVDMQTAPELVNIRGRLYIRN
jgi:hypothetical protein